MAEEYAFVACKIHLAEEQGLTFDQAMEVAENSIPLGRICEPQEVANVVTFLASEQASFVNGGVIDVDGGQEKALLEFDTNRAASENLGWNRRKVELVEN